MLTMHTTIECSRSYKVNLSCTEKGASFDIHLVNLSSFAFFLGDFIPARLRFPRGQKALKRRPERSGHGGSGDFPDERTLSNQGPGEASPGVWGFPLEKKVQTKARRKRHLGYGSFPQERRHKRTHQLASPGEFPLDLLVGRRTSWGILPRPPFSRFARRAVTGRA
jgi:hypothetical protein